MIDNNIDPIIISYCDYPALYAMSLTCRTLSQKVSEEFLKRQLPICFNNINSKTLTFEILSVKGYLSLTVEKIGCAILVFASKELVSLNFEKFTLTIFHGKPVCMTGVDGKKVNTVFMNRFFIDMQKYLHASTIEENKLLNFHPGTQYLARPIRRWK